MGLGLGLGLGLIKAHHDVPQIGGRVVELVGVVDGVRGEVEREQCYARDLPPHLVRVGVRVKVGVRVRC